MKKGIFFEEVIYLIIVLFVIHDNVNTRKNGNKKSWFKAHVNIPLSWRGRT